MKPAPFAYHDPRTVDEALSLLGRYGDEAKVLAGGQSLMPLLNFRLSVPSVLIDINRVSELAYIRHQPGQLHIGAVTRQRQIEFSELVSQHVPLLHRATRLIGHLPIRTRGTIGGSMVHADPAAEYPTVAVALGAEFVVRGPRGSRVVAAEDFFAGYLSTALMPDELLLEVRFPTVCSSYGQAFVEFARRHGDFALVGIAALLEVQDDRCRSARLATAGLGPQSVRLREVEQILIQDGLSEASCRAAAARAAELVEPDSDLHASAEFRRHLTRVLSQRAIQQAAARP